MVGETVRFWRADTQTCHHEGSLAGRPSTRGTTCLAAVWRGARIRASCARSRAQGGCECGPAHQSRFTVASPYCRCQRACARYSSTSPPACVRTQNSLGHQSPTKRSAGRRSGGPPERRTLNRSPLRVVWSVGRLVGTSDRPPNTWMVSGRCYLVHRWHACASGRSTCGMGGRARARARHRCIRTGCVSCLLARAKRARTAASCWHKMWRDARTTDGPARGAMFRSAGCQGPRRHLPLCQQMAIWQTWTSRMARRADCIGDWLAVPVATPKRARARVAGKTGEHRPSIAQASAQYERPRLSEGIQGLFKGFPRLPRTSKIFQGLQWPSKGTGWRVARYPGGGWRLVRCPQCVDTHAQASTIRNSMARPLRRRLVASGPAIGCHRAMAVTDARSGGKARGRGQNAL